MRPLILTLAATLAVSAVASADPVNLPGTKKIGAPAAPAPTGQGGTIHLPYWHWNGSNRVAVHPQPQPTLLPNLNRTSLNPQPLPPRWSR